MNHHYPKKEKYSTNCIAGLMNRHTKYPMFILGLVAQAVILFFSPVRTYAQIREIETNYANWKTVGEVKWLKANRATLKYLPGNGDTLYLLQLQNDERLKNTRDMQVVRHFTLKFNSTGNTLAIFYGYLISFFQDGNKKNKKFERTFKLGKDLVTLQPAQRMLTNGVAIITRDGYCTLTEAELLELFNK